MNILHISFSDGNGGAAIAALRLHEAMSSSNIESRMLVFDKTNKQSTIFQLNTRWNKKINQVYHNTFYRITKYVFKPLYAFELGLVGSKISKSSLVKWADVIYIHWCGFSFLSIKEIQCILKTNKTVFLYMHDMWYITGGCHHSFECKKYETGCNNCHLIQRKFFSNIVSSVLRRKIKSWNYNNLAVITPSNWLGTCTKNSLLFQYKNIHIIPNLIDSKIFKPLNRTFAKEILNLDVNKFYICFGAIGGSQNKFKGWSYFVEALKYVEKSDNIEIILFGGYILDEEIKKIPFKVHQLGHLFDKYTLAAMYSACNVYILPSLAENLPQTMMEALSCGAVGVGFNIGGMPDLIKHKQTGYLAKYQDSRDLGEGINWAKNNCSISVIEQHQFIEKSFGIQRILQKHMQLWSTKK